ncbi:MAG: PepSY-like domain-containing protein [Tannerellaceae bacterium]
MKRTRSMSLMILVLLCSAISLMGQQQKVATFYQLPESIKTFVLTHFDSLAIQQVQQDRDLYKIDLINNGELEFFKKNLKWKEIKIKRGIPYTILNTLPTPISQYLRENFPQAKVIEVEFVDDKQVYELKLNNSVELLFDTDGTFLALEN